MASKKVKIARGLQKVLTIAAGIGLTIIEWKMMCRVDFLRRSILTKLFLKIGVYFASIGMYAVFCGSMHALMDGVAQKWINKQENKKVIKEKKSSRKRNGNQNSFTDFRANAIEVDYDIVSEVCI